MPLARAAESLHTSAAEAVANSIAHVYQIPPECTRTPRPVLDPAAPGGVLSSSPSSACARELPGSHNTPLPGRAQLTPPGSTPAPFLTPSTKKKITKKITYSKKKVKRREVSTQINEQITQQ